MTRLPTKAALADRRGSAAIEFALCAAILLLILCATMDFGRLFWIRNTLQFAAQEAARYALANSAATAQELKTFAQRRLYGLDPNTIGIDVAFDTTDGIQFVTIVASCDFQFTTSLVPGGPLTLTGRAKVPRDTRTPA